MKKACFTKYQGGVSLLIINWVWSCSINCFKVAGVFVFVTVVHIVMIIIISRKLLI